jgi:hypothetical protein
MHTDAELLALLALGEPAGTTDERDHVASCAVCMAELEELRRVVELARSVASVPLVDPDPRVWAGISRDLAARAAEQAHRSHDLRAHARLTPVEPTWSRVSGEAELATDDRGRRLLQVALDADLPESGVRQAWLVHRDDPAVRQSLGMLDGRHGLWTVEHALDLELYPILEISQQSIGSSEHSGQTIVRGELVTAA